MSYSMLMLPFLCIIIFANELTEDPCENKICQLYPNAICLTSPPNSNNTIFLDDDGMLINQEDCNCNDNNKLENNQCLEHFDESDKNVFKPYYINIDLVFGVEEATCYQNRRNVLFSHIRECINNFALNISSMNEPHYPYIRDYSYLPEEHDNEFFEQNHDKDVSGHFHFNFIIADNVSNSTLVYDHTADEYYKAINDFKECSLLLSTKVEPGGFKKVTNTEINVQLMSTKTDNNSNIGTGHMFAFSTICFAVFLFVKKGLFLPVAKFWCNFFACCHHWHICYCYNPCCCSTSDWGISCCGFGCGCHNGCCPGCICTFCCSQCAC